MYNVADLFAGAGGLSLGFEKTGKFSIVAAVENNENAIKTYSYNNKDVKIYRDIRSLDFCKILDKHGAIDVVIGGPPCQGFSNANRQKRKIINGNNELVKKYVGAINNLKPKIFVMENVKTIASNKHSFYLTKNDKRNIVDTLGLEISRKDTIVYDRSYYINELYNLIQNDNYHQYMIDRELLDDLSNMIKSKEKFKRFLDKRINEKAVINIQNKLDELKDAKDWYLLCITEVLDELKKLKDIKYVDRLLIEKIEAFIDIQKLFYNISELDSHEVIYDKILDNNAIVAQMDTYIIIDYIKKSFQKLGYKLSDAVLKAADYGVPQKRERYILIGVKNEFNESDEINMPEVLIDNESEYLTVNCAIGDLEGYEASTQDVNYKIVKNEVHRDESFYSEVIHDSNEIFNHVCTDTRETALKRFETIVAGQNFHSLPDDLKSTYANPNRTQNTIYKRLRSDMPSDTVVNVRKSMWIHPVLNRAVSAREAARLQSFPDHYRFLGTKDSIYQQIGNAVPPILGQAIAEKVLELLGDKPIRSLKEIYNSYSKV